MKKLRKTEAELKKYFALKKKYACMVYIRSEIWRRSFAVRARADIIDVDLQPVFWCDFILYEVDIIKMQKSYRIFRCFWLNLVLDFFFSCSPFVLLCCNPFMGLVSAT